MEDDKSQPFSWHLLNRFESNMTINLASLLVQLLIDVLSIVNNDCFEMVQERFSHDIILLFLCKWYW